MTPRTFIIRPFGEKRGQDFDRVERELIGPALDAFHIKDRTTLDILRSGNIRVDMFHRLLTADLVICDVSIHNANVFYELGIRHALRKKHTILIRSKIDDIPFDLFTDRYLEYDGANPAALLDKLKGSIEQTLRQKVTDSPVFALLPRLEEPDPERFIAVPREFSEEAKRIFDDEKLDTDSKVAHLALLGAEIDGLPWESGGLRVIGQYQFKLDKGAAARETWERIRRNAPDDIEANLMLSTIYQRLDEIQLSEQALDRVMTCEDKTNADCSEALALRARNAKAQWQKQWNDIADANDRTSTAVASQALLRSFESYFDGYLIDLRSYPGINALAMAVILDELAKANPDAWKNGFADDATANAKLITIQQHRKELCLAVGLSIEKEKRAVAPDRDIWLEITLADLSYLRGESPQRVKTQYAKLDKDQALKPFAKQAMRQQLELYEKLGLFPELTTAALQAIAKRDDPPRPPHMLVFTGHRVDAPGRKEPRFPNDKAPLAKAEIEAAVDRVIAEQGQNIIGIAGAASGGDILFHEVCIARNIPTLVYLALPRDEFAKQSVNDGGPEWTKRYNALLHARSPRVLQEAEALPVWLAPKQNELTVWNRNNPWILHRGLVHGGANMTLLALWNGKAGDGPGGTEDMVTQARNRGASVEILGQGTIFPK